MALAPTSPRQPTPVRRIWKTPSSRARWLWLAVSLVLYGGIYAWYLYALKTQQYPSPSLDPLRLFGIIAFALVLGVFAYTLRRRYIRALPGKVQSWLWFHTWLGIVTVLIACLHENYTGILHDYDFSWAGFTGSQGGQAALYALVLLVLSGILGRLLDLWQTRIIAAEANKNGAGIAAVVTEHLTQLALTVERLCAGKSVTFKEYCNEALKQPSAIPPSPPVIDPSEMMDFKLAQEALLSRAQLTRSLHRQQRAQLVIRLWRYVHIPLAYLALAIIAYHGISELLTNVFHLLPSS